MTAVIHVNHVTKRFGRHKAVDNVSFEVPPGCVFALLGENGAGKTTLVRMMMGLLAPDAGGISVFGLDSAKRGEQIRRRVGYVPERPTLYEWMTAAEIGWFTAGFYGGRFEQHFRNLIDKYGVPFERKINQMSKGMRAKVSLSLAMAHQPELLVLDEPTSGLDTLVRREFLESMVDLAAEGRTVLLSSHLIGEVERVADYVAIVRDGQLLVIEQLDHLKRTTRELTVVVVNGKCCCEASKMMPSWIELLNRPTLWPVKVARPRWRKSSLRTCATTCQHRRPSRRKLPAKLYPDLCFKTAKERHGNTCNDPDARRRASHDDRRCAFYLEGAPRAPRTGDRRGSVGAPRHGHFANVHARAAATQLDAHDHIRRDRAVCYRSLRGAFFR
jgi:ABC-2 type transport system ATP-binding protein